MARYVQYLLLSCAIKSHLAQIKPAVQHNKNIAQEWKLLFKEVEMLTIKA